MFHAKRVTNCRTPCQGLAVQTLCRKNEGIVYWLSTDKVFIMFDVSLWVLATLLKTLITITHQIAAAVQHSLRGPSNPNSTLSELLVKVFAAASKCSFLWHSFGLSQTLCCLYCLGLLCWSLHNLDDGLTPPVRQFCCLHSLPRWFTAEMRGLADGLACFVYFAIGLLWEPAFQDPGRSTSFHLKILSLQSCSDVRLCSYRAAKDDSCAARQ